MKTLREKQFNFRLSVEELHRIEWLVDDYGITASDVVRMLIKQDFDRRSALKPAIVSGGLNLAPATSTSSPAPTARAPRNTLRAERR